MKENEEDYEGGRRRGGDKWRKRKKRRRKVGRKEGVETKTKEIKTMM